MLTFQQKLENAAVLLQRSSHNTAGKGELGRVLTSCWESPWETVLGFTKQLTLGCTSLVFQRETPVYFRQKTDPSQGVAQQQTLTKGWRPCERLQPDLWKSPAGPAGLHQPSFMNEKHCEVDAAFIMAVIFLLRFPVSWGFVILLITCGKSAGWKVNDWASNSHSPGKSHWNTRCICRLWVCPSYDFALPLSGSRVKNMVKWNFPEEKNVNARRRSAEENF